MSVNSKMTAIADAIRGKTGGRDALTLDQMAEAIGTIKAEPTLQELTITENGEYSPPDGVDGFDKVTVDVASAEGGNGITFLDCVTIVNDTTYGRKNGIILDAAFTSVGRIEALLKLPDTDHCIWFARSEYAATESNSPFIDKTVVTGAGATFSNVNHTVDENGILHYSADTAIINKGRVKIGSWTDATYSQTFSLYGLKLYDVNQVLICDLKPALSKSGTVGFYDNVSGIFYFNWTGYPFTAGEAV